MIILYKIFGCVSTTLYSYYDELQYYEVWAYLNRLINRETRN